MMSVVCDGMEISRVKHVRYASTIATPVIIIRDVPLAAPQKTSDK